MNLHRIVYVSSATSLLTEAALQHLLVRARARNQERDLTGLLMYDDGTFMQYLEGPRDALFDTYAIICSDPSHHSLFELMNEVAPHREFSDWAMAYRNETLPAFLKRQQPSSVQSPSTPGRDLLQAVWSNARMSLS